MDISDILLVFVVLAVIVIMLALLVSDQVRAKISLPGKSVFSIETVRKSVQSRPRSKGPSNRHLPNIQLDAPNKLWSRKLTGYREILLGTAAQNTVQLRPDSGADKVQARIYWNGYRYRIRNLSPTVPTIVNGKAIKEQNLGNGNRIQLGNTLLIFKQNSPKKSQ